MNKDNKTTQEIAAESISNRTGLKESKILEWAKTHNIDIINNGYIFVKSENWAEFFHDVSKNVFQLTKKLINN